MNQNWSSSSCAIFLPPTSFGAYRKNRRVSWSYCNRLLNTSNMRLQNGIQRRFYLYIFSLHLSSTVMHVLLACTCSPAIKWSVECAVQHTVCTSTTYQPRCPFWRDAFTNTNHHLSPILQGENPHSVSIYQPIHSHNFASAPTVYTSPFMAKALFTCDQVLSFISPDVSVQKNSHDV